VHVGILAAIVAQRLPVGRIFLGRRADTFVPETGVQNVSDIGNQPVRIRMTDDLRR
jgi:hypothetical protein